MQRVQQKMHPVRRDSGFTIVSMTMVAVMAGFVTMGAWTAYRNMNVLWKVSAIERNMDQYANMTFKEMSNLLGWGWCNQQIQGGSRAPRWKVYFQDRYNEEGNWRSGNNWQYSHQLANDSSLTLTYAAFRGVLLSGQPLQFAEDMGYVWQGRSSSRPDEMPVMNSTDRMSVVGLEFDWPHYPADSYDPNEERRPNREKGVITVTMTLQYRYTGNETGGGFSGLFPEEYVHERTYRTQIYMRNWEVTGNDIRKRIWG